MRIPRSVAELRSEFVCDFLAQLKSLDQNLYANSQPSPTDQVRIYKQFSSSTRELSPKFVYKIPTRLGSVNHEVHDLIRRRYSQEDIDDYSLWPIMEGK